MENIFDTSRSSKSQEIFSELCNKNGVLVEKIVSMGQTGDWQTADINEWVSVVSGRGAIGYTDGTSTILNQGDHLLIPAGKTHRVEFTSRPCVWLCVHFK